MIDGQGWHRRAKRLLSPNFNARPAQTGVALIVIHAISLPPGQFGGGFVERFFVNQLPIDAHADFENIRDLRVSAHFFIDRSGHLTQFVSTEARAWHAGQSQWRGREDCNDFSVGIELEGTAQRPFTQAQYRRCARLCRVLMQRYPAISKDAIVGHQEIAPDRKWDPGPCFDWHYFRSLCAL